MKKILTKLVLPWCSVGVGVLTLCTAFWASGLVAGIGTLTLGLFIGLPGAWHFVQDRRERKRGELLKRHWRLVLTVSAVGVLASAGVLAVSSENKHHQRFRNCEEAHAAGVANIPKRSPDYAVHLDEDHDGIACEK